ncbi:hypothetical protein B0H15DRAFT_961751 [Mycena belliarum]|uniref:Uncharacterized protein n=1 Tax=Mycena belliarum TaxID=1033014 RepID=A0AAD6XF22_9AGAR|nr:hypothetical protein B0H15DRAFT_961751 [Mycena belliae]
MHLRSPSLTTSRSSSSHYSYFPDILYVNDPDTTVIAYSYYGIPAAVQSQERVPRNYKFKRLWSRFARNTEPATAFKTRLEIMHSRRIPSQRHLGGRPDTTLNRLRRLICVLDAAATPAPGIGDNARRSSAHGAFDGSLRRRTSDELHRCAHGLCAAGDGSQSMGTRTSARTEKKAHGVYTQSSLGVKALHAIKWMMRWPPSIASAADTRRACRHDLADSFHWLGD